MWEFISQSIAGLFDPLYIALVIFVSQFFFRYVKSKKIHKNKPRFVLILGTLIAFSFLAARFIMGDSIPNLIHYALVLFLNFCFSTTLYELLVNRIFEALQFTHSESIPPNPTESEQD
ncbi:hypothetical protein LEP1GSC165_2519 [Leptospira santarosai str. CBC523]|uniref:hypothetical protein n=1 Tax=Leptospira santarosai TaxID=28183 RepID=UPI0002BDE671|nr:hypothetical protein [Leptospira santarosai]EMO14553.1 hypothetical protein LEP1GSC165_2519 [Leptospira santarosai str. CBC523]